MGDTWIPDDIFDLKPVIRNFFENTSTVQVICLYNLSIPVVFLMIAEVQILSLDSYQIWEWNLHNIMDRRTMKKREEDMPRSFFLNDERNLEFALHF
jgi:hypothetical protein